MSLDRPVFVVGPPEVDQGQAEFLDGAEGPDLEEVLLERPDEPLGASIALRRSDEGRGGRGAEPSDLLLEVAGHVLAAIKGQEAFDGVQYVSIKYTEHLALAGIEPSVGSVGDSYDNALAETVIGLYKTEVIRRRGPWRSLEAVELATLEWVDWFNNRRLLKPIGNIPPAEAEAAFHDALENKPIAA